MHRDVVSACYEDPAEEEEPVERITHPVCGSIVFQLLYPVNRKVREGPETTDQ